MKPEERAKWEAHLRERGALDGEDGAIRTPVTIERWIGVAVAAGWIRDERDAGILREDFERAAAGEARPVSIPSAADVSAGLQSINDARREDEEARARQAEIDAGDDEPVPRDFEGSDGGPLPHERAHPDLARRLEAAHRDILAAARVHAAAHELYDATVAAALIGLEVSAHVEDYAAATGQCEVVNVSVSRVLAP